MAARNILTGHTGKITGLIFVDVRNIFTGHTGKINWLNFIDVRNILTEHTEKSNWLISVAICHDKSTGSPENQPPSYSNLRESPVIFCSLTCIK